MPRSKLFLPMRHLRPLEAFRLVSLRWNNLKTIQSGTIFRKLQRETILRSIPSSKILWIHNENLTVREERKAFISLLFIRHPLAWSVRLYSTNKNLEILAPIVTQTWHCRMLQQNTSPQN